MSRTRAWASHFSAILVLAASATNSSVVGAVSASTPGLTGHWRLVAGPVDPPPMFEHAAVHDPVRHRLLMLDGTRPGELWSLSLVRSERPVWSKSAIRGPEFPPSRHGHTAVYDPAGDRVVVFGGWGGSYVDYADVWALSLGQEPRWTRIEPQGIGPHSRSRHAAAFDPVRNSMLVFGGYTYAGGQLGDLWKLDLAGVPAWSRVETGGRGPSPRENPGALYDPWGDRLLLFGGWVMGNLNASPPTYRISDETWAISLSTAPRWDSLALSPRPAGRHDFAAGLDREGRRWVISGGKGWQTGHALEDTWSLELEGAPRWTRLLASGVGPGAVGSHAGDCSPERGSLIQYGGEWSVNQNRCFELDLSTSRWSQIEPTGPEPAPARRYGALLLDDPDPDGFRLWGGNTSYDLWSFAPNPAPAWTPLETSGSATAAGPQNVIHDTRRNRLISINGEIYVHRGARLDRLAVMSLDAPRTWSALAVPGEVPVGRAGFGAIYDPVRDRVLVYGGFNWANGATRLATDLDDLWEFSLAEPRWRRLQVDGGPGKRSVAHALYDPVRDRMLLLGGARSGYATTIPVHDNWALDLSGDSLRWSSAGPSLPGAVQIVRDPLRDRLVAWNGSDGGWSLALGAPAAWQPLAVSGEAPTPRTSAGVRYDAHADRLLVFGGSVPGGFPDGSDAGDLHALSFSRTVGVDIRPGSDNGLVPLRSRGRVEAAVLGDESFSPESVIVATVTLAGAPADREPHGPGHEALRDVNHDGREDLVLSFRADELDLSPGDSLAILTGETPHFAILGRADLRSRPGESGRPRSGAPDQSPGAKGRHRLSIAVNRPAPSAIGLRLTLPSVSTARIEVFDIAGRRVLTRTLAGFEPGPHALDLDAGRLEPGVFLIRLEQDSRAVTARAVLIR